MKCGWLEQIDARGAVEQAWPVGDEGLVIGRGYGCDLRLNDPQSAALHLRIVCAQGQVLLESGEPGAALSDARGQPLPLPHACATETVFRIGAGLFRLRLADFAVAPAVSSPLAAAEPSQGLAGVWASLRLPGGWPLTAVMALVLLLLQGLILWNSAATEMQVSSYLGPAVGLCGAVLVWVGAWSLLSRLFGGQAHFRIHLRLTLMALLLDLLVDTLLGHLGYMTLMPGLGLVNGVFSALLMATLIYLQLRVIGPEGLRIKRLVVLGGLLIAGAGALLVMHEGKDRRGGADIQVAIKPAYLRLRQPVPVGAAMEGLDRLRPALEEARTRPLPPQGNLGGLFDNDD